MALRCAARRGRDAMPDRLEDRAARYILRQEEADWSPADQRELDLWLAESPRHKAIYWRLRHGWAAADRVASLNLAPARAGWPARIAGSFGVKAGMALAASLLFIAFLGAILGNPAPQYTGYTTEIGQRKTLTFADGSRIDMNTGSEIRVRLSDRERIVHLDRGEAYFEVAHSKRKPFLVFIGDRQIRVLGTKFAVRKDGGRTAAAVVEGKVQFGRVVEGDVQDMLVLREGDSVISKGSQALAVYDRMDVVENAIGWTRGLLIFDRISLDDAAREFNRYNRRKLVIEGAETGAIRIGGAFRPHNVQTFARLMADAYDLRVEEAADRIVISDKGRQFVENQ